MIDPIDLTITGAVASRNKLGITEPTALASAVADFTAFRLAELQTSPICGGFDSAHLQDIHRHLFQDIYEWAGELRGAQEIWVHPILKISQQSVRSIGP